MDTLSVLVAVGVGMVLQWFLAKLVVGAWKGTPKQLADPQQFLPELDVLEEKLLQAPWSLTLERANARLTEREYTGSMKGRDCRLVSMTYHPKRLSRTELGALVEPLGTGIPEPGMLVFFAVPLEEPLWEDLSCWSEFWTRGFNVPFSLEKDLKDRGEGVFLNDPSLETGAYIGGKEAVAIAWLDPKTRDCLQSWAENVYGWLIEGDRAIAWVFCKPGDFISRRILGFFIDLLDLLDRWETRRKDEGIVALLIKQVHRDFSPHYQALAFDALTTHFREEQQVEALIEELLDDPDQELRWLAAEATGVGAIPRVCEWITREDLTDEQRRDCLSLLQQIDEDSDGGWRDHLVEWTGLYDRYGASATFVLDVLRLISYREVDKLVEVGQGWLDAPRNMSKLLLALLDVYKRIDPARASETMPVVFGCLEYNRAPELQEKALKLVADHGTVDDFTRLRKLRHKLSITEWSMDHALKRMATRLGISPDAAIGGLSVVESSEDTVGMLAISDEEGQLSLAAESPEKSEE